MRSPRVLLAASLLTLTACGPTLPLNTGLKPVGSDILFGHPAPPPQPPPLPQVRVMPAPLELPPPLQPGVPATTFSATPLPLPPACPDAPPDAVPPIEAPPSATAPCMGAGSRCPNRISPPTPTP